MKELSTESINIGGVDYTLFLNRTGIVAWEKFTKDEKEKLNSLQERYQNIPKIEGEDFEKLSDEANPFEGLEDFENIESDLEYIQKIFGRLYWIMLYTNHKLSISEAKKLYEEAIKEYGLEQIVALGRQMVEDVNKGPEENEKLKNLTALKPRKN